MFPGPFAFFASLVYSFVFLEFPRAHVESFKNGCTGYNFENSFKAECLCVLLLHLFDLSGVRMLG